jgi:hypothetical protein
MAPLVSGNYIPVNMRSRKRAPFVRSFSVSIRPLETESILTLAIEIADARLRSGESRDLNEFCQSNSSRQHTDQLAGRTTLDQSGDGVGAGRLYVPRAGARKGTVAQGVPQNAADILVQHVSSSLFPLKRSSCWVKPRAVALERGGANHRLARSFKPSPFVIAHRLAFWGGPQLDRGLKMCSFPSSSSIFSSTYSPPFLIE